MQEKVKPYQVGYERDGVVSNIIVLASSPEEELDLDENDGDVLRRIMKGNNE